LKKSCSETMKMSFFLRQHHLLQMERRRESNLIKARLHSMLITNICMLKHYNLAWYCTLCASSALFNNNNYSSLRQTALVGRKEQSASYTTVFSPRNIFQKLAIMNKNSIIYKLVNFRTGHPDLSISVTAK
uniref:MSP domain-containing protein n=1 Tax=Brugia timori TaxID=42155 RepID=A0A0R3R120_9BILA